MIRETARDFGINRRFILGGFMSRLGDQVKKLKYDKRLINSNLKKGELSQDEYNKYIQSLEDCADRSKNIKITQSSSSDSIN